LVQGKERPTTHTGRSLLGGRDEALRQKDRRVVPVLSFTEH